MVAHLEVENVADGLFYFPNARITKFHHLPTCDTDEMIVLFVSVRFFEKALAGTKLVSFN